MSNDIDAQVIQKTQKLLGKYIKKPPLTDKLLRKPPFRFLHDVVNSVIREKHFLKGLYTERELVSENVKDKDEKIAFLNKLIDAIRAVTGIELNVRSSKVIAGLEPTETNLLLQAIGTALDKKLDSSQYIAQLKSEKKIKSQANAQGSDKKLKQDKIVNKEEKKKKSSIPTPKNAVSKTSDKIKGSQTSSSKDSVESSRNETKGKSKIKKVKEKPATTPKENTAEMVFKTERNAQEPTNVANEMNENKESNFEKPEDDVNISEENEIKAIKNVQQKEDLDYITKATFDSVTENPIEENNVDQKTVQNENSYFNKNAVANERIKSAKPKGGILKINSEETAESITEVATERLKSAKRTTSNAKLESDVSTHLAPVQLESNFEKPLVRPRSSLRPPSVRPSSARPGAPRLRNDTTLPEGEVIPLGKVNVIVESYNNKEEDEEETVTLQAATETEYQATILQLPTDKGHLVEQILEQIHHDDVMEHAKPAINIEWEQDGFRTRNTANKEIEQLKSAIQILTRTANPLGKLVNYLHEDIEAMHSELDVWISSGRQIMVNVLNEKRISNESNKPLQAQLEEIEDNIVKHQQQIVAVHGNILRNEQRIRDLLNK